MVYEYEVKKEFSRETLGYGEHGSLMQQTIAGYRGRVWIDRENSSQKCREDDLEAEGDQGAGHHQNSDHPAILQGTEIDGRSQVTRTGDLSGAVTLWDSAGRELASARPGACSCTSWPPWLSLSPA